MAGMAISALRSGRTVFHPFLAVLALASERSCPKRNGGYRAEERSGWFTGEPMIVRPAAITAGPSNILRNA